MTIIKQLIKFCLVGLVSAVIDFGSYWFMTRWFGTHYFWTSLFTSALAVTAAFINNRRWTFSAERELGQVSTWHLEYVKYLSVYGLGIVWQNGLLLGLVELGQWPDWLAKITAILVVAFAWNFLLAKLWVFRYTQRTLP